MPGDSPLHLHRPTFHQFKVSTLQISGGQRGVEPLNLTQFSLGIFGMLCRQFRTNEMLEVTIIIHKYHANKHTLKFLIRTRLCHRRFTQHAISRGDLEFLVKP